MTRNQKAREALISEGISSAHLIDDAHLGDFPERNRKIVQAAIFDGETLKEVGERFGLSKERARGVALSCTLRAIGRYEGVKEVK